jgi:hypothetical protein
MSENRDQRFGLVDVTTNKLIGLHREISRLSGEELKKRLLEKPEKFSEHQLGVVQGISTDKVLAHEKGAKESGSGLVSEMEKLAAKLAESGASMEIQVAVRPHNPADDAIDVTPPGSTSDT